MMCSCVLSSLQVVAAIVESGKKFSAEQKKSERCPLLYEWHKKQYVGAAHGMAGIYYLLLQVCVCKRVQSVEKTSAHKS